MSDYVSPDFDSIALVTIDVQRDLLDGAPYEIAGTSAAAAVIAPVCEAFRKAEKPIVHIVRLYREDGANVDACRRTAIENGMRLVIAGSTGAQMADDLVPQGATLDIELLLSGGIQELGPSEVAIYKPRWGAFFETPLEAHLRGFGVTTLAFCGCNFPNCPRTSIYEASERDFRVIAIDDAISGIYDRGREEIRNIGVQLMRSDEVVASLPRVPASA